MPSTDSTDLQKEEEEATSKGCELPQNSAPAIETENANPCCASLPVDGEEAGDKRTDSLEDEKQEEEEGGLASSPSEESSISKVWETIQRDLNSGGGLDAAGEEEDEDLDCGDCKEEGEVDAFEEMLLEHEAALSIPGSPVAEEEEEPSDWEDREAYMEEEEEEEGEVSAEAPSKKAVSECVLISSDDEGGPQRLKGLTDATKNDEEDEDERLQLDTSSEMSETPSHKRAHDFEASSTSDTMTDPPVSKPEDCGNSKDVELAGEETDEAFPDCRDEEEEESVETAEDTTTADVADKEVEEALVEEAKELPEEEVADEANEEQQQLEDEEEEQIEEKEDSVPMDVSEEDGTCNTESNQMDVDDEPAPHETADSEHEEVEASDIELGETVAAEDVEVERKENDNHSPQTDSADADHEPVDAVPDQDHADDVELEETSTDRLQENAEENDSEEANVTGENCDTVDDSNGPLELGDEDSMLVDSPSDKAPESDGADVETEQQKSTDDDQATSAQLAVDSPTPQESKLVSEEPAAAVKEVVDLESVNTETSKTEEHEEKSSVGDRDKVADVNHRDPVPDRSKSVDDDDFEVLDVEDGEDATKEVSQSERDSETMQEKEEVNSSVTDTATENNAASEDVTDKEVETIDLEDSGAELSTSIAGSTADAASNDKEDTSKDTTGTAAVSMTDCKSSREDDGSSKEEEEPCDEVTVLQKEPRKVPEIVVLDLENDSEVDQKEHDSDDQSKGCDDRDVSKEASDVKKGNGLVAPVEVDLASDTKQNIEDDDLKDDFKLGEEMESDADPSSRKRHLSQQSQNHINCMEQSKRPKLDLSEEPMEEALKQLDVLRMKEKKQQGNCTPTRVKLTKEVLEELINRRLHEHINNSQKSIIDELRSRCDGLEKAVERWKKKAQSLQSSIGELNTELQKHQRKPRGPTRTVGINVRISTTEPLRPLNSKLIPVLPKPQEPSAAKPSSMSLVNTTQAGPVPMHLVPNLATSPNKPFVAPSPAPHKPGVQNVALAGGATVKIIDLTHEDDEAAQKNIRQPQVQVQAVPVQQNTVVTPNFSAASVMLSSALTRTTAPITLQTTAGGPLMGMPVNMPVTMQLIPSVSSAGGGVTLRGARPTVSLPGNVAPPGSRVTTYLVPSGLPALGSPRQIVPISGAQGVVQSGGPRPAPPMQTFLLRMNAPASTTFTTLTTGSNLSPSFNRGPAAMTVTSRNVINPVANANQPSVINAAPKNVNSSIRPSNPANTVVIPLAQKHPAPFPQRPSYVPNAQFKAMPPKPALKISKVANGIVLSWNLTLNSAHAEISKYQLYAYQEGGGPPLPTLWKKVGDVKALPLPMACTLTQFMEGNKYHFAICAVDKHNRCGPFSDPSSILLVGK